MLSWIERARIGYLQGIWLHIALGFAIYIFRPFAVIYFFATIFFFVYRILTTGNKNNIALLAASYIMAAEGFLRMTISESILPWDAGKYSVMAFVSLGLFFKGTSKKSVAYWIYILLLLPGVVYAAVTLDYSTDVKKAVFFNLSGPICLGIAALYTYDRAITKIQLQYLLWAMVMPVVAMTTYLFFYSPATQDVLNGTSSNFALSGGFGPNQVSTALGIGMFAIFVQVFVQMKNRMILIVNVLLLGLIAYRAIITFSRGGVLTAIVVCAAFLFIYYSGVSTVRRKNISAYLVVIVGAMALTWFISSIRTRGLIDLRYANKDAAGRIKEDLSTGRKELISSEIDFFLDNPIMGIGVGKTKEYREEKYGILAATHNEISRMLSEHGIFGVFALILLILTPLSFRLQNRKNYLFYSFMAFWFLTINHSSMRIAAPALMYALALLNVVDEKKNPVHRKQVGP